MTFLNVETFMPMVLQIQVSDQNQMIQTDLVTVIKKIPNYTVKTGN